VANYCSSKLTEQGFPMMVHHVGWEAATQLPADGSKQWLELTCNGVVGGAVGG
jgi:hypothetical protein